MPQTTQTILPDVVIQEITANPAFDDPIADPDVVIESPSTANSPPFGPANHTSPPLEPDRMSLEAKGLAENSAVVSRGASFDDTSSAVGARPPPFEAADMLTAGDVLAELSGSMKDLVPSYQLTYLGYLRDDSTGRKNSGNV